jgi:hypothetical protein
MRLHRNVLEGGLRQCFFAQLGCGPIFRLEVLREEFAKQDRRHSAHSQTSGPRLALAVALDSSDRSISVSSFTYSEVKQGEGLVVRQQTWTWHANRGQRGLDRIATGGASRECEEARAAPDIAKLAAFGRYCGSEFGTERPRIAAQARAVDRSRASSASPHLAKGDRKPVALSAPGVTSGRTLTLSHYSFLETMETWKPTRKFCLVSMY